MSHRTPPEIRSRSAAESLTRRGMLADAILGFRYGALLGLGLILIGVLRFIVASASHDVTMPKWQELELLIYYVATFAVAGSVAGAVLPRIRSKAGVCAPEIVAGEVEVLPAERGKVGEQRVWDQVAAAPGGLQRAAEVGPDPTLLSPAATLNQLRSSLVRMSRSKRP